MEIKRTDEIRTRFLREKRFGIQSVNDIYLVEDVFTIGDHGVVFAGDGNKVTRFRRKRQTNVPA